MKLGDLRHRVELYTITTTADGEGGTASPVYTLSDTRWANVTQLSESEVIRSGLAVGERVYRVTLLKSPGETLSKSTQIRWNSLRLNISSVLPDEWWITVIASDKE